MVEIYEITNQQAIKKAIDEVKSKPDTITVDEWDAIAKDNVMVTKLSQLEKGTYYKFVIDDFAEIESQFR